MRYRVKILGWGNTVLSRWRKQQWTQLRINLLNYCQEHQEKFTQLKNPCIAPNSNENLENWSRITTLIVGDTMLALRKGEFQRQIESLELDTSLEKRLMALTIISRHEFIKKSWKNRTYLPLYVSQPRKFSLVRCLLCWFLWLPWINIISKLIHAKHKPKIVQ